MSLKKRGRIYAAGAVLVLLACGACRRGPESGGGAPVSGEETGKVDAVVLQVGDGLYHRSDFESYVRRTLGGQEEAPSALVLSRMYDRFVEDKLLLESARRKQVGLSQEEMKDYLLKVKSRGDPDKDRDLSETELKGFRDKLLVDKYTYLFIKDIAVDDEEVRAYYEENKGDFLLPERFEVSQILTDSEEAAIGILNRVRDKSFEDFARVAREVSTGVEAGRGGRMGIFSRGQLPYEIERVVLSLEEGQISRVVESSYGFHIFLLSRRIEPELVSLDKASPGIRMKLLDRKISRSLETHLEELKTTLEWKSLEHNLPFAYQRIEP
ncbi:MAG: hypothetical protein FJY83_03430 [Candidatus Aminicenantes bacterium]|nr:hypothetical protein [Candidatus Aminicenantes bacterium]